MIFTSTVNPELRATFKEVVLSTIPKGGGLYVPLDIPKISRDFLKPLKSKKYSEFAYEVLKCFLGESIDPVILKEICNHAYPFSPCLKKIENDTWILELFHGPTLAFKDFGVRFMAHLLSHYRDPQRPLTILTATSGDTGGAVASAFHKLPGVDVFILFPKGKISLIQEKQITSLGENIRAFPVEGSFDLCQRLVKEAFIDREINSKRNLSSANSINLARLIPQICYYAYAVSELPSGNVVFSVPSGNFGNLTAGLYAKKMGLPIEKFIASTNENDVVPRFLMGEGYVVKPFMETLSTAMDIADPSNFVRIQSLYQNKLEQMRRDILGVRLSDKETEEAIGGLRKLNYIVDPHTAVAYGGLIKSHSVNASSNKVFLSTAHPIKFQESVERILGEKLTLSSEMKMLLEEKCPAPKSIKTYEDLKVHLLSSI